MNDPVLQSIIHRTTAAAPEISTAYVLKHYSVFLSCLKQLESALAGSDTGLRKQAWTRFNKSKATGLVAFLASCGTKHMPSTVGELEAQAQKVRLGRPSGQPVQIKVMPKQLGGSPYSAKAAAMGDLVGYRVVNAYGPVDRAKDWLLCRLLGITLTSYDGNYLVKGRGLDSLAEKMKEKFASEFEYAVVFDVRNFYPSVKGTTWLKTNIKLSERLVMEEVFTPMHTKLIMANDMIVHDEVLKAARAGLPQGRTTSLLVAGILYGGVMETLFPAGHYFYYGDDGIVFAGSMAEAESIVQKLRGAFGTHPAGPFLLKRCEVVSILTGFDFTKYHFRKNWDGEFRIHPASKSFHKYEYKVSELYCKNNDSAMWQEIEIHDYTMQFLQAFPQWKKNALSFKYLENNMKNGIEKGKLKMSKTA